MERYFIFGLMVLAFLVGLLQCTGLDPAHIVRACVYSHSGSGRKENNERR